MNALQSRAYEAKMHIKLYDICRCVSVLSSRCSSPGSIKVRWQLMVYSTSQANQLPAGHTGNSFLILFKKGWSNDSEFWGFFRHFLREDFVQFFRERILMVFCDKFKFSIRFRPYLYFSWVVRDEIWSWSAATAKKNVF